MQYDNDRAELKRAELTSLTRGEAAFSNATPCLRTLPTAFLGSQLKCHERILESLPRFSPNV